MRKIRTLGLKCYSLNDILENAPKIQLDPKAIVLSITSTDSSTRPDLIELGMVGRSEDVLYLKFDDIGREYEVDLNTKRECYGLSEAQAQKFIEWFEEKITEDKNLYLHCEAGLSRSQGFVRFILDCYPDITWLLRLENPCLYPNQHVVSTLKKMWRKKYTPEYES